jgi:hypothetical protein
MKLSEAFVEAWQRQRETAPRRALVKQAFETTRRLPGIKQASSDEIRSALVTALAARGIDDCPPRSIDVMIRAIQTSRTSVLADYAITGVQKTREVVAWLKEHQVPAWLAPPDNAVSVDRLDDVEVVVAEVDLEPRDLALLARLLAEAPVPVHLPEEVDDLEPYFRCWLDLENAQDPQSAVVVHAGKHLLGRLDVEAAAMVRSEVMRLVRRRKVLLAGAELHGATPETVSVEIRLVVSPED